MVLEKDKAKTNREDREEAFHLFRGIYFLLRSKILMKKTILPTKLFPRHPFNILKLANGPINSKEYT